MTSGKTSVSKFLKSKYKIKISDLDHEISKKYKMPITQIFEKYGETKFRTIESAMIKKIIQQKPAIVSLGGGSMLKDSNVKLMKRYGVIVWLKIKPKTVISRLSQKEIDQRPLLRQMNRQNRIKLITRLIKAREVNYKQADFKILADQKKSEECAKIIYEKYQRQFKK